MLTKKERLKDLPYKTIPACEKAYHELIKNMFEFDGLNSEELEGIKTCIYLIYRSMWNNSKAQIEKNLKKEYRIESYQAFKNQEYEKAYNLLFNH